MVGIDRKATRVGKGVDKQWPDMKLLNSDLTLNVTHPEITAVASSDLLSVYVQLYTRINKLLKMVLLNPNRNCQKHRAGHAHVPVISICRVISVPHWTRQEGTHVI